MYNSVWLPLIHATSELKRARAPEPDKASNFSTGQQYEAAISFKPTWVRGQAYLQANNPARAEEEFLRIIKHRAGMSSRRSGTGAPRTGAGGSARGRRDEERKAYEDFFMLWKDADAELPILIEAKKGMKIEVRACQYLPSV